MGRWSSEGPRTSEHDAPPSIGTRWDNGADEAETADAPDEPAGSGTRREEEEEEEADGAGDESAPETRSELIGGEALAPCEASPSASRLWASACSASKERPGGAAPPGPGRAPQTHRKEAHLDAQRSAERVGTRRPRPDATPEAARNVVAPGEEKRGGGRAPQRTSAESSVRRENEETPDAAAKTAHRRPGTQRAKATKADGGKKEDRRASRRTHKRSHERERKKKRTKRKDRPLSSALAERPQRACRSSRPHTQSLERLRVSIDSTAGSRFAATVSPLRNAPLVARLEIRQPGARRLPGRPFGAPSPRGRVYAAGRTTAISGVQRRRKPLGASSARIRPCLTPRGDGSERATTDARAATRLRAASVATCVGRRVPRIGARRPNAQKTSQRRETGAKRLRGAEPRNGPPSRASRTPARALEASPVPAAPPGPLPVAPRHGGRLPPCGPQGGVPPARRSRRTGAPIACLVSFTFISSARQPTRAASFGGSSFPPPSRVRPSAARVASPAFGAFSSVGLANAPC